MTTVLVTGAGSSPGLDLTRCLRLGDECHIIGGDAGEWGRRSAARLCDEVIELPLARDDPKAYAAAVSAVDADFVFYGLDIEVEALIAGGGYPELPNALPPFTVTDVILDKAKTVAACGASADFPGSAVVDGAEEIADAFDTLGGRLWLRPSSGTSGKASTVVDNAEEALFWTRYWQNRGLRCSWLMQQFLPGRNFNWTALYREGERLAWASMERHEYFLAGVAPSGVTGQVQLCETVAEEAVSEVSERIVRQLDPRPHGLYSVDLREDADGRPRVTEVNPRPAGRPYLFARAGANLPLAALRALSGESPGDAVAAEGCRPGVHLYRQLDMGPMVL